MFVYNLKLNKNSLFKTLIFIFSIICLCLMAIFISKIYNIAQNSNPDNCLPKSSIAKIEDKNYTNILKMVNENLDNYIGQEISYTGYVYRVSDIKSDEFILARDMVISESPKQTAIVGFLATCKDSNKFENGAWVTITATIEKGFYLDEVPILKISEIKRASKPDFPEVPMPDNFYVPTSVIY